MVRCGLAGGVLGLRSVSLWVSLWGGGAQGWLVREFSLERCGVRSGPIPLGYPVGFDGKKRVMEGQPADVRAKHKLTVRQGWARALLCTRGPEGSVGSRHLTASLSPQVLLVQHVPSGHRSPVYGKKVLASRLGDRAEQGLCCPSNGLRSVPCCSSLPLSPTSLPSPLSPALEGLSQALHPSAGVLTHHP